MDKVEVEKSKGTVEAEKSKGEAKETIEVEKSKGTIEVEKSKNTVEVDKSKGAIPKTKIIPPPRKSKGAVPDTQVKKTPPPRPPPPRFTARVEPTPISAIFTLFESPVLRRPTRKIVSVGCVTKTETGVLWNGKDLPVCVVKPTPIVPPEDTDDEDSPFPSGFNSPIRPNTPSSPTIFQRIANRATTPTLRRMANNPFSLSDRPTSPQIEEFLEGLFDHWERAANESD